MTDRKARAGAKAKTREGIKAEVDFFWELQTEKLGQRLMKFA
ncbi:hypothetical protein [Acidicapsa ligni]|nr:hypothetical protein [Acidicapsa ligni]